ncbi:Uncharacterised protein [Serratia entomophila]|uniref:hypothetical protein n=1 Tax=Serratia entomophila TaxID=42906 RepID=UPI00217CB5FE|nr:hypothetical protein [Serratia entomophila]CAI1925623.1 Uncharacterised protein [Serratia entomophila]
MDKLREEFENWIEETHGLYGEDVEWQERRNCYAKFGIHLAFQAWQASRASIVVDIDWPEANDNHWKDGEEGAYAQGYEVGKDLTAIKVRQAIRSIGLSIKGE